MSAWFLILNFSIVFFDTTCTISAVVYIYYLNTILDEKQPLHRSSSPIINYVLEEKFKIPRG
jgi:hypothetical protein